MAFDLSTLLKPVSVRTRFLGRVEVEARIRDFQEWFRNGRREGRWKDGPDLVRSLLAEQSHWPGGRRVGVRVINRLTARQINAFSKAFIKAAGKLIVPHLIEDRPGGRLRTRREGEEYPTDRGAGETDSARLLRMLADLDDERRARSKQHAEDMRKMLEGPADLFRRIDPIGDQINKLRREVLGSSVMGQLTALGGTTALRAELETQARSSAEQISRAIEGAILGRSALTSIMRQRDFLASQLADRESEMSRARARLGIVGTFGASDSLLQAELAQRRAWGESVRQLLNPSLSSGLLASMMGVGHRMAASAAIEAAAGLSRGFMTTANLGLMGAVGRGAAADVLSQYRADPSSHSDLFRDVMSAIQLVDAEELVDEDLAEGLGKAQRNTRRIDLTNPAQVAILLSLLGLLVSAYVAVLQLEALELARSSATSTDVRAVQTEIRALRTDQNRAREAERLEWRHIRYVIDATPLRAEPNREALVLLTVYPDQLVRVLEAKGGWARVEVIPYRSGAAETGWIARRRLRARPQ